MAALARPEVRDASCDHAAVELLNPFELIRKYRCEHCGSVMMCACDEDVGRRVLPHQLRTGTDVHTQQSVPVTAGFVERLCRACRGLSEPAYPVAEGHGRTSKIKRYYWRELRLTTLRRFAESCDRRGEPDVLTACRRNAAEYERIEREVLEELKRLHATSPKYRYDDDRPDAVLRECGVEVMKIDGLYVTGAGKDRPLVFGDVRCSPEEYATAVLREQGYHVMRCESRPIQTLYGVLMWLWVQDPADPTTQPRFFGGREDSPAPRYMHDMIGAVLPTDFGTKSHPQRRAAALDEHLNWLPDDRDELLRTFDYWVEPSASLCAYLWAYTASDIERARLLIDVVGARKVKQICRFLAESYWARYLGWPDLFVYGAGDWFFVEVKSSKDRLSQQQLAWLRANHAALGLPVRLMKIHRRRSVAAATVESHHDAHGPRAGEHG